MVGVGFVNPDPVVDGRQPGPEATRHEDVGSQACRECRLRRTPPGPRRTHTEASGRARPSRTGMGTVIELGKAVEAMAQEATSNVELRDPHVAWLRHDKAVWGCTPQTAHATRSRV